MDHNNPILVPMHTLVRKPLKFVGKMIWPTITKRSGKMNI